MKLSVVALDYDGTIAADGVLDPCARTAIDVLRAQSVAVIIVTGRILADLQRVAGDLRFVDAIVAENGALLYFPHSERTTLLGHRPAAAFSDALCRHKLDVATGICVVEASADTAQPLLDIIRTLELPLTILFNRGRLMVLPQGISKASGLNEALRALRLSSHNVLAIGDAENDHPLLDLAEVGVAVGWGSAALQAAADMVLEGNGPTAVGPYLRSLAGKPLPIGTKLRRHLLLGHDQAGQAVELGVRNRNILIAGDTRSGKSWLAGLLCEQLILHRYCVCVIDPEGDYRSLETLPGVMVVGNTTTIPEPHDLIRELRYPDVSLVLDLSGLHRLAREDYVTELLPMLAAMRRSTGLPHRIVIDEAHYFLRRPALVELEQGGHVLVTYRLAELAPQLRQGVEALIATRVSQPAELEVLRELLTARGTQPGWETLVSTLPIDEALLLPGIAETGRAFRRFRTAARQTRHVRHLQKYLDVPVSERRAFVFTSAGVPTGARAATMQEFEHCLDTAPEVCLDGHLRRGDFSRWIAGVFGDVTLATRVRQLETQYQLAPALDVRDALLRLIADRYMPAR